MNPTSSPTPTTLMVATLALIHFILIWTIAARCSIRKCCFTPDRTRSLKLFCCSLSFPPAWSYSSSPTPSLLKIRSNTLCNVFVPTIVHTLFLNPDSAMALFIPLLRPFCFALYSPRHLSEGDISNFLLYALEFITHIMPGIRPTSSFPSSPTQTPPPIIAVM